MNMLPLLAALVLGLPMRAPIEDTFLSQSEPDQNFGRELALRGGPKHLVQLRFPALDIDYRGQTVTSAQITFRVLSGDPKLKSIGRVTKPWREGPGVMTPTTVLPSKEGVNWRGAPSTEPISGWQAEFKDGILRINGLAPAVNRMVQDPLQNFGLALEFESECILASSENPALAPALTIEAATAATFPQLVHASPDRAFTAWPREGESLTWSAEFVSPADWSGNAEWLVDGESVGAAVPLSLKANVKGTATAAIPFRIRKKDRGFPVIQIKLGAVVHPVFMDGLPVGFDGPASDSQQILGAQAVERLNRHALPMSRFAFAQEGVPERFRWTADPKQAVLKISAERSTGLAQQILAASLSESLPALAHPEQAVASSRFGLTADTRDNTWSIPGVPITAFGWADRFADGTILPEQGLLGRAEAALLTAVAGKLSGRTAWKTTVSSSLLLRVFDLSGRAPGPVAFVLRQGDTELLKGKTLDTGALFISPNQFKPSRATLFGDVENPWLTLDLDGARSYLPWTALLEESLRGSMSAVSLEIRAPLVGGEIDMEQNLALNRSVEDSLDRFPAELVGISDGNPETSTTVPPVTAPYWLEIDLGRDRLVADVELSFDGPVFEQFDIMTYKTGQAPTLAQMWISERRGEFRSAPNPGKLRYQNRSVLARYIRIAVRQSQATKLREIVIRPLAAPAIP